MLSLLWHRPRSQHIRIDYDTSKVQGWNCFDAAKLTGSLELPSGDVVPDKMGRNKVTYEPLPGTHGSDAFDFELSDCLAYGPPKAVTIQVPAPDGPF